MWFFGKKKQNKVKDSLIEFLNTADDSYMNCLKYKDITLFQDYCCDELATKINDILADNPDFQIGIANYRKRQWTVIEHECFFYAYQKDTTHDNITINRTLSVPLGDEFHEVWKIREILEGKYTVIDIIRQKEFIL